jgi:hypothetical protein
MAYNTDWQPSGNYGRTDWKQYWWVPAIIISAIVITIIIAAIIYSSPSTTASAIIVESDVAASNLRVLNDTEPVTYIYWGTLRSNSTYTHSFTVACDNTMQVTAEATAWTPTNATNYLTFNYTCTYAGIVTPYSSITITFQLTVAETAPSGNFSFAITVLGTETPNRFVQAYGDWQIYRVDNVYVAVHAEMKRVVMGVDLPDLKADIDEAMR